MKRAQGMMYPKKAKKNGNCTCTKCGEKLTPATAYYYVDGCNCDITNNAPPYCKECYKAVYGA